MPKIAELTTDGWRGQPSKKWAEHDVLNRAAAFAASLEPDKSLVIGFDGRAGSRELAMLAAHAFSNIGIQCIVSSTITPTPAVGRFVACQKDAGVGLIFTASHNPPGDFGLKVRLHDGLAPLHIPLIPSGRKNEFTNLVFDKSPLLETDNRINEYYRKTICDPLAQAVRDFPGEVIVDAVFGALGVLSDSLYEIKWRRNIPAPFFFGITPDPVLRQEAEPEMEAALASSKNPKEAMVFMTDGDGDRLCIYTQKSGYVTSTEQALALIHSGLPLKQVISTCVVESTLREVAALHGIAYRWTQVGFKNITADWKTTGQSATIGIEPNGGLAFANSSTDFFERDGLATALLVLAHFGSVDVFDTVIKEVRALRRFDSRQFTTPQDPNHITGFIADSWPGAIKEIRSHTYELTWPSGWRVLIRRSGTEPLTRCYVEGPSKLHRWFKSHLKSN